VEVRLQGKGKDLAEKSFAATLTSELRTAHVIQPEPDDPWDQLSSAGEITMQRPSTDKTFLAVITRVGIQCGYDESVYLYEWKDRWVRRLESEQNDYAEKAHKPQRLEQVLLSDPDREGNRLFLTAGFEPWCSSNWHDLYTRVWRVGREVTPLLDDERWAFSSGNPAVKAQVTRRRVLLEFTMGRSFLGDFKTQVEQYRFDGAAVQRIDPVALTAENFVDEWMAMPWDRAVQWSQTDQIERLKAQRDRALADEENRELGQTYGVPDPLTWVISLGRYQKITGSTRYETLEARFFVVRLVGPYAYRMVSIEDKLPEGAWPARGEPLTPTLFPAPVPTRRPR
jgi:hypothetical protein